MTRTELCKMCAEYYTETECKNKKDCKLQNILTENTKLRVENKKLNKKIQEMETRRSWEKSSDMMGK